MAVDKKSEHYTSAEVYRDLDGNHKTFTYIDHDKKIRIAAGEPLTEDQLTSLKESVSSQIDNSIEEILALPALSAATPDGLYEEFVTRDMSKQRIVWQEEMVRDACRINHNLRHNLWNTVWKNTVKSQYWFEEMDHEDILNGKWEEWI